MKGSDPRPESLAELFSEIAQNVDEVFWLAEPGNRKLLYVSPGCERVWGLTRAELLESPRAWLERVHPDDRVVADTSLRGNEYRDDEYRLHKDGGLERWVRARVFPIRDASRRAYRIAGLAEDITGRKRVELSLRQREAELRQAQKMEAVGRLAGGVSHDFNNILTVIMGYAGYLLERIPEGQPYRPEIQEMEKATHRAAALTRQLLAFSRRQVLQTRLVDLNVVAAEMQRMLVRLIGDDVELVVEPAEGLGRVSADQGQLEQVLMNLAVNARDAMPRGGRLTLSTGEVALTSPLKTGRAAIPPGRYVTLSVDDTGVGMDAIVLAHLFEPFFTTKEPGKGTGLGLATVHGIVTQSGGHVAVESEPGKGTSFTVYLPRAAGPGETSRAEGPRPKSLRGSETLLLVEDEPEVRELVRRSLAEAGYRVLEAGGPAEALWLLERHHAPIHLLLTDVVMRQMNGFDLADRVESAHRDIKVLFMSGYTEYPVPEKRSSAPFLLKPFTPPALLAVVRGVLDG